MIDPDDGFLGIDHVPFNYRLREARIRMGWTRKRLAEEAAVNNSSVGLYESLKEWPGPTNRQRLADALREDPEYLFPTEVGLALRGHSARTTTSVLPVEAVTIESGSLRLIAGPDPIAALLDSEEGLEEAVEAALAALPNSREVFVIRQRFGIGTGAAAKTLGDVADMLGVTPERVRQIEAKALRKLRHPRITRRLKGWLLSSEVPARIDRKIAHYPWEPDPESGKPDWESGW